MPICLSAFRIRTPILLVLLAGLIGTLTCGPQAVQAQPEPMLRVAVHGDSAYVYHTRRLPSGHGFHLYRMQEGDTTQLTEAPVRGVQRPGRLPRLIGDRYEWLRQRYGADGPADVYYTMRGDWSNGLFAAFLDPSIARALGLLHVDVAAPVGEEVTYRAEFVDADGDTTGQALTKTVSLTPRSIPAPSNLEASNEERRVTLDWQYPTASREADDQVLRFDVYRVLGEERAQRVNGQDVILRNSARSTFSYEFRVPRTGVEETFFVAAVDITGRAVAFSDRLTTRIPDNEPPAPVGGVKVYDEASGEAQISWSMHAAPDAAGYHLYRAPRLEAEFRRINDQQLDLLTTTYIDSTVQGRHTYHYRVTVVDSAGNESEKSNAAMAQVLDQEPPPAPTALRTTFDTTNGGQVRLRWTVDDIPTDLKSFQVLRHRLGEGTGPSSYAVANDEPVRDTTFVDDGVGGEGVFAEGAHYRYAVVAIDSARNVTDSTFSRLQIPDRTPPVPPNQVQALNEAGIRGLVKWTRSPDLDVTRYRIYRGPAAGRDTLWREVPADRQFVPDDSVQPGRQYRYAVSAVDSLGNEGPRSATDTLRMRTFDAPAAVRNVQAQARSGTSGVALRWEAVPAEDVVGYRVYRTSSIPTGIYEPVHEELITGTTFTDPGGAADMWYRVRAVDTSGNESRPSDPARAVPTAEE